HLVRVLQRAQVDVAPEVGLLREVGLVRAGDLLVQRLDARRQQAVQAEPLALLVRERRAFVEEWVAHERHAAKGLRREQRSAGGHRCKLYSVERSEPEPPVPLENGTLAGLRSPPAVERRRTMGAVTSTSKAGFVLGTALLISGGPDAGGAF